jgi:hypothetical protein
MSAMPVLITEQTSSRAIDVPDAELSAIKEAISRVEADAKAVVAAEARAEWENRARQSDKDRRGGVALCK